MRLSSLLVVGALVFGGLYVARNLDNWRNRLHQEKAHAVATLKQRVNDEEARIRQDLTKRVRTEKTRAAAALKKRAAKEKAQAAAALKKQLAKAKTRAGTTKKATTALPAAMTETAFWGLISETRNAAGNDTGKQSELLKDQLTRLSPQAIVAF